MLVRFRAREERNISRAAGTAAILDNRKILLLCVLLLLTTVYGFFLLSPTGAAVWFTFNRAAAQRASGKRLLFPYFFLPATAAA
jgi:hypothetical protein